MPSFSTTGTSWQGSKVEAEHPHFSSSSWRHKCNTHGWLCCLQPRSFTISYHRRYPECARRRSSPLGLRQTPERVEVTPYGFDKIYFSTQIRSWNACCLSQLNSLRTIYGLPVDAKLVPRLYRLHSLRQANLMSGHLYWAASMALI